MKKTNAMRILEAQAIPYEVVEYMWDEEHLDAVHASEVAGLEPSQVFKTIVLEDSEKQIFVFCLPADFSVSLKKVKALTGSKDIELLKLDRLQSVTGYIRGGCSPLGMKRKFPTFIEEVAQTEPYIHVSAGMRGLQLRIKPEDLVSATQGQFADFT
ncbi:Cys-tRNA(Pro) deacylase [Sphaerochaeta sp. S2]|uniref:Cys-tRNA(Pro) deacylase n=1 Tax=Sphaerochaeta sp. S2 TaxID=2798868 RepID=UPI0018EA196F|nr:Cys-tRNA(Pro) deacylase [Sphaerochaeta sp. S2]MBJ2357360.1 Cys-tRNA(Pro) deacylase [Sphaerochaeta sp. S2]